jgi:hypothetical protein
MHDSEGFAISSARNEELISMFVPDGVRENDLIRRDKDFRGAKGMHPLLPEMGIAE